MHNTVYDYIIPHCINIIQLGMSLTILERFTRADLLIK